MEVFISLYTQLAAAKYFSVSLWENVWKAKAYKHLLYKGKQLCEVTYRMQKVADILLVQNCLAVSDFSLLFVTVSTSVC